MDEMTNKFKEIGMKLSVWGCILVATLCIYGIVKFFSWVVTPYPETYVNYNANDITDFSTIENVDLESYEVKYNTFEEPVGIIDIGGLNKENYKEIEQSVYSPLIMYVNEFARNPESGFSVSDTDSNYSRVKIGKNLSSVLEGIEQGKTWQDIGINEQCLEGPIQLAVPDAFSPYRELVKDLFILNLTAEEITVDNYPELSTRADAILEKCIQVENPRAYLTANKKDDKVNKVAVIAPEYIMANDNDKLFRNIVDDVETPEFFVPVYPTRTTAISYSLYVKEELEEKLNKQVVEAYTENSTISKKTGFRTKKSSGDYLNANNVVFDLTVKYISKDIKDGGQ